MTEIKINLLKGMNEYICNNIGDEECWEIWIACGVPDEATEDVYEFIATNHDEWLRICKLFGDLVNEFEG